MASKRQNGNVFKGNATKKNNKRKNAYVDIREKDGEVYGIVEKNIGSHIMSKIISEEESVKCSIPGKFRARQWFKPGDYIVLYPEHRDGVREIKGRVLKRDLKYVREIFSEKGDLFFGEVEEAEENDNDNLFFGIKEEEEDEEKTELGYTVSTKNSYQNDMDELFAQYEDDEQNNEDYINDI